MPRDVIGPCRIRTPLHLHCGVLAVYFDDPPRLPEIRIPLLTSWGVQVLTLTFHAPHCSHHPLAQPCVAKGDCCTQQVLEMLRQFCLIVLVPLPCWQEPRKIAHEYGEIVRGHYLLLLVTKCGRNDEHLKPTGKHVDEEHAQRIAPPVRNSHSLRVQVAAHKREILRIQVADRGVGQCIGTAQVCLHARDAVKTMATPANQDERQQEQRAKKAYRGECGQELEVQADAGTVGLQVIDARSPQGPRHVLWVHGHAEAAVGHRRPDEILMGEDL
mmetsp:Transcript_45076/g.130155  ORF Transcript_45076/g.130155 Transcript_45076/m.130155 type:complete len:272 (-) Transcript_45076:320-1135(-)